MPTLDDCLRNGFAGMTQGPRPLVQAIMFYAGRGSSRMKSIESDLVKRIRANPNDETRKLFNDQLKTWDWETDSTWTAGTKANTSSRRKRIYDLLQLSIGLRKALDVHVPPYQGAVAVLVDDPKARGDWYTSEFRRKHDFYWKQLRKYLGQTGKLSSDSINSLNKTTTNVLERLGDPAAAGPMVSRGLVVGYVQSGKTTNFTGVIAKAIDAGYRLVIILSGTTNLLRNQTQRRLDIELAGRENILREAHEEEKDHDYKEDDAWPAGFTSYGRLPSLLGQVDIVRLTTQRDFESMDAGLNQFEFEKRDRSKPLYDRENLDHAGARMVIVKKQTDRLGRLLRELRAVGESRRAEIPALVIDDESDQASVNTLNPAKAADKKRSRINECVVKLLHLLPRAQYVGYTATPFASVFTDPTDPTDIYPKDFMLSLETPADYMGAREFHDFVSPKAGRMGNESAYVRSMTSPDSPEKDWLAEAIDAFLLTGAIKKFREHLGAPAYKHHTMLVHESPLKRDQQSAVERIRALWRQGAYDSPGSALKRLGKLLEVDFRPVWKDRGERIGLPFPSGIDALKPHIGKALDEIRRSDPVLMVNSAEGADVPNFDKKAGVWKIIVGGAKLSRGYTIEGLTISYFRRRAKMQDTLMQMGRWFGYRPKYSDLVRLYIGRAETDGKHHHLDLYKAFEGICRDEDDFRAQLAMYEGTEGFTPKQVPALVFNSYPRLRPTARNKMFNAVLTWAAFDYREPTTQAIDANGRKHNAKLFGDLIRKAGVKSSHVRSRVSGGGGFDINWCRASVPDVLEVLEKLKWEKGGTPIAAELAFLRRDDIPIDSWILLAPQIKLESGGGTWPVGSQVFRCILRSRAASKTRFGVYSSPEHLKFAKWIVGAPEEDFVCEDLQPKKRTGVLLFYPTRVRDGGKPDRGLPVMGFGMALPVVGERGKRIAFSVKMPSNPNAVVVAKSGRD